MLLLYIECLASARNAISMRHFGDPVATKLASMQTLNDRPAKDYILSKRNIFTGTVVSESVMTKTLVFTGFFVSAVVTGIPIIPKRRYVQVAWTTDS